MMITVLISLIRSSSEKKIKQKFTRKNIDKLWSIFLNFSVSFHDGVKTDKGRFSNEDTLF